MEPSWEVDVRASYDRVAAAYTEATRGAGGPYMTGVFDTLAALVDGPVADVGCGPGWWSGHLHERRADVIGIDLSPAMLERARANAPGARFAMGSVLDLPLATGSCGGVACWYVLHHLPDDALDAALGELTRVLAPGGVLLLGGHVGAGSRVKTSGYGGLPMNVLVDKRPAELWESRVQELGLVVEAHTVFDPSGAAPSHALFARRT